MYSKILTYIKDFNLLNNETYVAIAFQGSTIYALVILRVPNIREGIIHSSISIIKLPNQTTTIFSNNSIRINKMPMHFLHLIKNYNSPRILLATASVRAHDSHGNSATLRALIDSGSQISFIKKAACKKLKLKSTKTDVQVLGLGKRNTAHVHRQTELKIQSLHSDYQTNLNVLIVNKITDHTPTEAINISNLPYLDKMSLADPNFATSASIDLLLGAEVSSILEPGLIKGNDDTPSAQATHLGWILMVPTTSKNRD